jgi:maleylacetoacetate isomerase
MTKLHGFFRSSAAYRVRIALNLKNIPYDHAFVHLLRGEQHKAYAKLNPQKLVPALEIDGALLTQSLAILEYLEETRPEPPLLPKVARARARVRGIALQIACDIHPLNPPRILNYLAAHLGVGDEAKHAWYCHWIAEGLTALETTLAADPATGEYCHGARPSLADVCLVPQLANARRFKCPLDAYPTLRRIEAACLALSAFDQARPENQPDAE